MGATSCISCFSFKAPDASQRPRQSQNREPIRGGGKRKRAMQKGLEGRGKFDDVMTARIVVLLHKQSKLETTQQLIDN